MDTDRTLTPAVIPGGNPGKDASRKSMNEKALALTRCLGDRVFRTANSIPTVP